MDKVQIFTDGACRNNPGPGAWAAILRYKGREKVHEKILTGSYPQTTNNRMELEAVIHALEALTRNVAVHVITDSLYVVNLINGGGGRANQDLVKQLRDAMSGHEVIAEHVPGHNGHSENELCHNLAQQKLIQEFGE